MPRQNNIQFRKGTLSQWSASNTIVLASGEPAFETDTLRLKIGNGITAWSGLKYVGLAGTGTNGYLPKFNESQGVANSLIYDNGTNVGIGTTNPANTLEVNGTLKAIDSQFRNLNLLPLSVSSGSLVTFIHPESSGNTVYDTIIPGELVITRGYQGGIYNLVTEEAYDMDTRISPQNTLWNAEGWDNLQNFKIRNYFSLYDSVGGNLGTYLPNAEMIMKHVPTNRYWKIKFTYWQQYYGGAFTYTRQEITSLATELKVSGNGLFNNSIISNGFIKSNGTSNEFLKADGSVDSTAYQTHINNLGSLYVGEIGGEYIGGDDNLFNILVSIDNAIGNVHDDMDNAVRTTGNQAIYGIKTFNNIESTMAFNTEADGPILELIYNGSQSRTVHYQTLQLKDRANGDGGSVLFEVIQSTEIDGLSLSENPIGVVTTGIWRGRPIEINKGGTGRTSYSNGQLLIGSGTGLAASTLTQGSNIQITNGSGTITIAATGLALSSRTITPGSGLDGSAALDLSADRTFNVGQGDGINVSADAIAVDSTVVRTIGSQSINGIKTFGNMLNVVATGNTLSVINIGGLNPQSNVSPGKLTITKSATDIGKIVLGCLNVNADAVASFTNTQIELANGSSSNITFVISPTGYYDSNILDYTGAVTSGYWRASTIQVEKGGTGKTSYSNGQLLIGSGTSLAVNTLTAGTGISITNGSGTITINSLNSASVDDNTIVRTTGTQIVSGIKIFDNIAINESAPGSLSSYPFYIRTINNDSISSAMAIKQTGIPIANILDIRNDGNIAIGTVPEEGIDGLAGYSSARLHVKGSNNIASAALKITNSGDSSLFVVRNNGKIHCGGTPVNGIYPQFFIKSPSSSVNDSSIVIENSNFGTIFELKNNSNVLIGGSNSIAANADSSLGIKGTTSNSSAYAIYAVSSNFNQLFAVRNDGRAGIGTNEPSGQFHVIGTGIISSRLGINTNSPAVALDVSGTISANSGNFTQSLQVNGTGVSISGHNQAESTITFTDITTGDATTSQHGYLPKLGGGITNFLRADGSWATPPDTNTTYSNGTGLALNGTVFSVNYGTTNITACVGNDSRLSDTRNTTNSLTVNNSGNGDSSSFIFNGSNDKTLSYNSIGAPSISGTNATGTWNISVSGEARTVSNGVYTTGNQNISGIKTFFNTINVGNFSLSSALVLTNNTFSNTLSSTSGNIIINPYTSGSLQRDSGGDARGIYAIDWQTVRSSGTMVAAGTQSVIGGGINNSTIGARSVVCGGGNNNAIGTASAIGGGNGNTAGGVRGSIGGGIQNGAWGTDSVIGGGSNNSATGANAVIGGGSLNITNGDGTTIAGGANNNVGNPGASIGGGNANNASALRSTICGGSNNSATGRFSTVVGGDGAKTTNKYEVAHSAGFFLNAGDSQHTILVAKVETTGNALTNLFTENVGDRLIIPDKTTWTFGVKLSAYNNNDNLGAGWNIQGCMQRTGSVTTLIGTNVVNQWIPTGMSGVAASVIAATANNALTIQVSGLVNKDIRWVGVVDISQVSWGVV